MFADLPIDGLMIMLSLILNSHGGYTIQKTFDAVFSRLLFIHTFLVLCLDTRFEVVEGTDIIKFFSTLSFILILHKLLVLSENFLLLLPFLLQFLPLSFLLDLNLPVKLLNRHYVTLSFLCPMLMLLHLCLTQLLLP